MMGSGDSKPQVQNPMIHRHSRDSHPFRNLAFAKLLHDRCCPPELGGLLHFDVAEQIADYLSAEPVFETAVETQLGDNDWEALTPKQCLRVHADFSALPKLRSLDDQATVRQHLCSLRLSGKTRDIDWDALGNLRGLKVLHVEGGGKSRSCLFKSMLRWPVSAADPMSIERFISTNGLVNPSKGDYLKFIEGNHVLSANLREFSLFWYSCTAHSSHGLYHLE